MAFLGYLPKFKRGLGIACRANFLHDFPFSSFLHDVPYLILFINGESFNVIPFFLLKIPNKMSYKVLI